MEFFGKQILRLAAIIGLIGSAFWFINDLSYEPVLVFVAAIATYASTFFLDKRDSEITNTSSKRLEEDRKSLIDALDFLFDERLSQSLEDDLRASLNLDYTPQAVQERSWLNKKDLPEDLLADDDITKNFLAANRKLLILGKPGAGKTTTLYRLATKLLAETSSDNVFPLPIIFELSRWAQQSDLSIRDWLASEMKDRFGRDTDYWLTWIDETSPRIIPLLDGFDEIPEDKRQKCAELINEFAHYATVPLVVCSRIDEYALLEEKLKFNAIEIRELSESQIVNYLESFGRETTELQALLMQDDDLLDLAKTPLFLNILILAYRGKHGITDFQDADSDEERRKSLFTRFIDSRFQSKAVEKPPHNQEDTLKWIRWLAHKLSTHELTDFMDNDISIGWLETKSKTYTISMSIIYYLFVLYISRFFLFVLGINSSSLLGIISSTIGTLFGYTYFRLQMFTINLMKRFQENQQNSASRNKVDTDEPINIDTSLIKSNIFLFIISILSLYFTSGLFFSIMIGLITYVILSLLGNPFWLKSTIGAFSLGVWLSSILMVEVSLVLVQATTPRLKGILNIHYIAYSSQILALYITQSFTIMCISGIILLSNDLSWLSLFLPILLGICWQIATLVWRKVTSKYKKSHTWNTLGDWLIGGILIAIPVNIYYGILSAIVLGICWGFTRFEVRYLIRYWVLRIFLKQEHQIPLNLYNFLDYCVRLRLLVRVGGSYKFMHRSLQEHFAGEYEE